jgi:hypothetical protein
VWGEALFARPPATGAPGTIFVATSLVGDGLGGAREREHRSCVDGRATACHLHGKIESALRAVLGRDRRSHSRIGRRSLEIIVPPISRLTTGALCPTRTTMVLMLVNLQGAAAIFRVGRHHHRGPFCEGRSLTHALTDTPPTDAPHGRHATHRWVPSHSPTVSCAYRAAGCRQPLPTCSPSMPSSARATVPACRRAGPGALETCAIGLPWALVRKHTPGSGTATGAGGRNRGKCGDVGTRA